MQVAPYLDITYTALSDVPVRAWRYLVVLVGQESRGCHLFRWCRHRGVLHVKQLLGARVFAACIMATAPHSECYAIRAQYSIGDFEMQCEDFCKSRLCRKSQMISGCTTPSLRQNEACTAKVPTGGSSNAHARRSYTRTVCSVPTLSVVLHTVDLQAVRPDLPQYWQF